MMSKTRRNMLKPEISKGFSSVHMVTQLLLYCITISTYILSAMASSVGTEKATKKVENLISITNICKDVGPFVIKRNLKFSNVVSTFCAS